MTTINKPFLSQPPLAASADPDIYKGSLINDEDYASPTEHVDEELVDGGLPVPLYVIAAAALLG